MRVVRPEVGEASLRRLPLTITLESGFSWVCDPTAHAAHPVRLYEIPLWERDSFPMPRGAPAAWVGGAEALGILGSRGLARVLTGCPAWTEGLLSPDGVYTRKWAALHLLRSLCWAGVWADLGAFLGMAEGRLPSFPQSKE